MKKIIKPVFSFLLLLLVVACKSTKTIDNHRWSNERIVSRSFADSIYIHDSIVVKEKADTVFEIRMKTIYRDRWLMDTLIIRDTLNTVQKVSVEKNAGKSPANRSIYVWIAILLVVLLLLRKCGLLK